MTRNGRLYSVLLSALVAAVFGPAGSTRADHGGGKDKDVKRVTLTASGVGLFSPVNIGVDGGPGVGLVIGDGSGLSAYRAQGNDFRLNGHLYGPDIHLGGVQSVSSGMPLDDETLEWPAQTVANPYVRNQPPIHVMRTRQGDIYLQMYYEESRWQLSATEGAAGVMRGIGVFYVVGGTGKFHRATGRIPFRTYTDLATEYNPARGGQARFT